MYLKKANDIWDEFTTGKSKSKAAAAAQKTKENL